MRSVWAENSRANMMLIGMLAKIVGFVLDQQKNKSYTVGHEDFDSDTPEKQNSQKLLEIAPLTLISIAGISPSVPGGGVGI